MNMKRGLTMVELAVALALLGLLALALTLLLGQMGRGSQKAQAEAQLQADLQEVRARLTDDVLLSTALNCTPTGASLTLPSGTVTYSLSGGQVLRDGVALTLQRGYGGSFSCDGRTLILDLTWEGVPVATIAATRRVGLVVAGGGIDPTGFPPNFQRSALAMITGTPREVRDISWQNNTGRSLYLVQTEVLAPFGYRVQMLEWSYSINGNVCYYFYSPANSPRVPTTFSIPPSACQRNSGPGQTWVLNRLRFNVSVDGVPIRIALTFCLQNTDPCPTGQGVRVEQRFVCEHSQPRRQPECRPLPLP